MAHRLLIFVAAPLLAQEFHTLTVIPDAQRTARGSIELRNQADQHGAVLRAGASMFAGYTLDLPNSVGSAGECLKLAAGNALEFGSCGASSGWSLSGDELSPVETSATLDIVRSTVGQALGSLTKPWTAIRSSAFQIPFADGLSARVNLTTSALTGYDAAGTQKLSLSFLSGVIDTKNTVIVRGAVGADTDVLQVLKDAPLSSSNWRWSISHRADGRQAWFYGYDGTNFSVPIKLNPTGNSVCVNCSSDATAGYSLDVGGQVLSTGYRASGAGGYVNAPQVEVRDPLTGFHWGMKSTVQTVGERSFEFRDSNAVMPLKMWTMQSGGLRTAVDVYGELQTQDVIPDADAGFSSGRSMGTSSRRWYEMHSSRIMVSTLFPKSGTTEINLAGDIVPIGTRAIGNSSFRVGSIHVDTLDVTSCTGCGGGGSWTQSGSTLYPTATTLDYEVRPNPANRQFLGGFTAPWGGLYTRQITVPNTANTFYRVSLTQGGMDFTTSAGAQSIVLDGGFGTLDVQGSNAAYRLASTSGGSTVFSATTTAITHTALAGTGNASACINSSGQIYRGSPGC